MSLYHYGVAKDQKKFLVLLISFFSIVLGYLAFVTHWADTELWAITLSGQLFSEAGDYSLMYKLFFNLLLKSLYIFDLSNLQTIHGARFIFWIVGLGVVWQVYLLGLNVHKDKRKALFACFILITSSFFLSRGFRVRSDLLACFFQLMYLNTFIKYNFSKENKWCFVGLISVVCLLLSTPKSILFLFVILSFIIIFTLFSRKFDQSFKFLTITLFPSVLIGFLTMIIKKDIVLSALRYFINSFGENSSRPIYFSIKSFYFVFKFLEENPLIVLAMVIFVFSSLKIRKVKKKTPLEKALVISFFFSLARVVLHNDRLPFYINAMTILPVAICAWGLSDILDKISEVKKFNKIYVITLLVFLAKGGHYAERNAKNNNNNDQSSAILYLEDYMNRYEGITYYDGMGSMPRNNKFYHFITPTLGQNIDNTLRIIGEEKPDMIFFSNRMFYHVKAILELVKESSYVYLGNGIYGKYEPLKNLSGANKVYKYQGSFFQKLTLVEGDFDENQKMKVHSRFSPIELPSKTHFFEIFDFDPKF